MYSCSFLHVPSNVSETCDVTLCLDSLQCPVMQTLSVTNLSPTALPVPSSLFLCVQISAAVTTSCTLLHDLCAGYVTYIYWMWH